MKSLAVKYRPTTFSDVVGQDTIVKVLSKQVELKAFRNCYIFYGSSGCGKTTVARIFANMINEGVGYPIEIDGASNNGVDNIKNIVSSAYERSISSKYKIYIIDECHMLTIQAWNAFLKCIEEPPTYTIFIFCTTDIQKVPSTIVNRCQKFNFLKVKSNVILDRLRYICESEKFINYDESIDFISRVSGNQLRDAIANLEKVADNDTNFDIDSTIKILGKIPYKKDFDLINALIDGNEELVINAIDDINSFTVDWRRFVDELIGFILDVYKFCIFNNIDATSIPGVYLDDLKYIVNFDNSKNYYSYVLQKLLTLKDMIKTDVYPLYSIQITLLQIARCE